MAMYRTLRFHSDGRIEILEVGVTQQQIDEYNASAPPWSADAPYCDAYEEMHDWQQEPPTE